MYGDRLYSDEVSNRSHRWPFSLHHIHFVFRLHMSFDLVFFSKNHNWDNAVLSLFVVWVRLSIWKISLELFFIISVFFCSRISVCVCVCAMRTSVTYGYPFENCDYKIELNENEGMSVINPGGYLSLLGLIGYYGYFKPGSSCRYTVRTPPNYAVKIQCDIDIAVTVGACSGVFGICQ